MVYRCVSGLIHKQDCFEKKNVVVFRMVVFRPFTSEVIMSKVKTSDEDGVRCALSVSFGLLYLCSCL